MASNWRADVLEAQATKNSDVITLSAAEYMNNGIHEPVGLAQNKNAQSQLLWAHPMEERCVSLT